MKLTPRQIEILQHALGVDKYGRIPRGFDDYTRNYFCAGFSDEEICRGLVSMGLMWNWQREWLPYYNCSVTEAGIKVVSEQSPKPPTLTRAQRRYRAFLNCDFGLPFIEWLNQYGSRLSDAE